MIKILSLPYGYFEACSYLIELPGAVCLIDPAVEPARLPANLPPILWILATHGHFDHISQADSLRQKFSAPLLIHAADADCLTQPMLNLSVTMQRSSSLRPAEGLLQDGQILELEKNMKIEVIHTPGHTPGGVCFLLTENLAPVALFTGDTLFAGSIGRLDLGGSASDMKKSLIKLQAIDQRFQGQHIPIYPGHGIKSDLKTEIMTNPYFLLK